MSSIRWLPLESNPEVMNNFLEQLGVPKQWGISDIISLDEELLPMVPGPVHAVLLLFPVSNNYIEHCKEQEELLKADAANVDPNVFFMLQTIRNACGTVAIVHAVANSTDVISLDPESILGKFLLETKSLSPRERADKLENSGEISAAHESSAEEGQTETPNIDDKCNLHFIALVNVNSKLYELDGRKEFPISHGETSRESFLSDAAKICKEYMARDPDNLNFTALALGAV